MSSEDFKVGDAIRREVLGSDYVDRKAATTWSFAKPHQELLTEYIWGAVWSRPGLSRRDRSLLNLGILAASNRSEELAIHMNGALNNGVTPEEIREVCIQIGAYCGGPAGLEALRTARKVFEERGVILAETP